MISLKFKSLQNLYRKSPDQTQTNALEVVVFYELIKVDAEQLKSQKCLSLFEHISKAPTLAVRMTISYIRLDLIPLYNACIFISLY